jgi:hypothetical protein
LAVTAQFGTTNWKSAPGFQAVTPQNCREISKFQKTVRGLSTYLFGYGANQILQACHFTFVQVGSELEEEFCKACSPASVILSTAAGHAHFSSIECVGGSQGSQVSIFIILISALLVVLYWPLADKSGLSQQATALLMDRWFRW